MMPLVVPTPLHFPVRAMIERSMPRAGGVAVRALSAAAVGGAVFALLSLNGKPELAIVSRVLIGLLVVGLVAAMGLISLFVAQALRDEQAKVERVEEFVMLRQWPQAAAALHGLLLSPMRSQAARVQSLLYLSSVLARYHAFEQAIEVQNYLLDHGELEAAVTFTIRVARAMAMLRQDHLLDADRAITEIRRMPGAGETAAFALVRLYRDVKTRHFDEAIEGFTQRRGDFGRQLGHRSADAFILAAIAFDNRGNAAAVADCVRNASLMSPSAELVRRYPEAAELFTRYAPAAAPPEAA